MSESSKTIIDNKMFLYGDSIGYIELLDTMGCDLDIVNAARVSFNVEHSNMLESDVKLLKYLWDNKHTSPFEHCIMKFRIKVPLFVAKQHMRHRTWSYNEISRRYTSANVDEVYIPKMFRTQSVSNRQASTEETINPVIQVTIGEKSNYELTANQCVLDLSEKCITVYNKLVSSGVCREQARGYLPVASYTTYIATANLLNVLKFLGLRDKPEAQYEMRELAKAMKTLVASRFPRTYEIIKSEDTKLSSAANLTDYIMTNHPDIYAEYVRNK